MKFTVTKAALAKELQFADHVIDRKHTIPILQYMLVEAQGDTLKLASTSLENWLLSTITALSVSRPGAAVIPITLLHRMVGDFSDGPIEFSVEKNTMTVTSGKASAKLPMLSVGDFPTPPVAAPAIIAAPAKTLHGLLSGVRHAVYAEISDWSLRGAYVTASNGKLSAVATDRHRVAEKSSALGAACEQFSTIVPAKAIDCLLKVLAAADDDAPVGIGLDDTRASWVVGSMALVSNSIVGEFPQVQRAIPRDTPMIVRLDSEPLQRALSRLQPLLTRDRNSVRFQVTKGELVCVAETQNGSFKEPMPVDYDGLDFEVAFQAQYVVDALDALERPSVQMCLRNVLSAVSFRPVDGDDARFSIMPTR